MVSTVTGEVVTAITSDVIDRTGSAAAGFWSTTTSN
jgi:hypothetical protein